MKKFILALVIFASVPAFAGKMKEIYIMTQESVLDHLGFDESVIKIEGLEFIQVEGADLAVLTNAVMYYSVKDVPAAFQCVTTFVETATFYEVVKTKCTEIQQ